MKIENLRKLKESSKVFLAIIVILTTIVNIALSAQPSEIRDINVVNTPINIATYYRELGQFPDILETSDLLKAADDWRDNIIPPGFSVSITTNQLLALADEWRNSSPPPFAGVNISGFSFQPQIINVVKGTTITWTNKDTTNHTVTSDTGLFDSGIIVSGNTYSFRFDIAGNYSYHCNIHSFMTGGVNVS